MNELNRHRSFADPGSDPLHRSMSDVAHGEDAGHVGLKQERIAVERPFLRTISTLYQVGSSQENPPPVPLDGTPEPVRPRQGSDKNKHRTRSHPFYFARIRAQH